MKGLLSGLKKFTVESHSTIEVVFDSGQKIMLDHNNKNSVHRPNKLFGLRDGDAVGQNFYFDGKTFVLFDQAHNYYTKVDAPNNISDALDHAVKYFDLTAPGADLLYNDSYERLSKGLISGFYIGKGLIDGVICHHLAFRNESVDWQIWIQTGDKPLPKRYVITSRCTTSSPQFSLNMTWDTNPDFSDEIFKFVVPEKAEQIELLTKSGLN